MAFQWTAEQNHHTKHLVFLRPIRRNAIVGTWPRRDHGGGSGKFPDVPNQPLDVDELADRVMIKFISRSRTIVARTRKPVGVPIAHEAIREGEMPVFLPLRTRSLVCYYTGTFTNKFDWGQSKIGNA